MQKEPKNIDHNPDERRPSNGIWWAAWGIVALLWVTQAFQGFDWPQMMLGVGTGAVLATWAIEITGNKAPSWMIPRPRKRYFPPPIPGQPATGPNGKALFIVVPAIIAITGLFIWLRV
jgi:hypothetical protein